MSDAKAQINPLIPLYASLLAAQQCVGAVEKSSTNSHHKYKYASSEDMLAAARDALITNGLVVVRTHYELDRSMERGDASAIMDVVQHFKVIHAETGAFIEHKVIWPAIAAKARPDDKAIAGALTSGLSYYMRDLLMIPRVDEQQMDKRNDDGWTPGRRGNDRQRQRQAPQQQPQQPQQQQAPQVSHEQAMALVGLSLGKHYSSDVAQMDRWLESVNKAPLGKLDAAALIKTASVLDAGGDRMRPFREWLDKQNAIKQAVAMFADAPFTPKKYAALAVELAETHSMADCIHAARARILYEGVMAAEAKVPGCIENWLAAEWPQVPRDNQAEAVESVCAQLVGEVDALTLSHKVMLMTNEDRGSEAPQ